MAVLTAKNLARINRRRVDKGFEPLVKPAVRALVVKERDEYTSEIMRTMALLDNLPQPGA